MPYEAPSFPLPDDAQGLEAASGMKRNLILQWNRDLPLGAQEQSCQHEAQQPGVASVRHLHALGMCIVTLADGPGALSDQASMNAYAFRSDVKAVEMDDVMYINRMPNDARFADKWDHYQGNDKDMDSTDGWDITTGATDNDVVIAVIDTGVDYNHEDLRNRMWTNPGEIPNNGIDDDNNGLVDDIYGADFANNDGNPMDDQGHGTHCAGIVAAEGNNGVGVAGVAWQGVKIMALKFLTATGSGRTSDGLACLNYALDKGAKISSNSYGGGGRSAAMEEALSRAKELGHLFIAAAGNESNNNDNRPSYPCAYGHDNVMCVASTDRYDDMSSFSNYGITTVDVGAPGSAIMSCRHGGGYVAYSGTSMACPNVAGLAGLLSTYRPDLDWAALKQVMMSTVDPISALQGKVAAQGRINVHRALLSVQGGAPPAPTPTPAPIPLPTPAPTPLPTPRPTPTPIPAPPEPEHAPVPRDVHFVDDDSRPGFVGGRVTFRGPQTEPTALQAYDLLWDDGTPLLTVPARGPTETPQCSAGNACSKVSLRPGDFGSWILERRDHGDNEVAEFTFTGPGTFTVEWVDLERDWDFVYIGDRALTGKISPEDLAPFTIPGGPLTVKWKSDEYISKDGFALRFTPEEGYCGAVPHGTAVPTATGTMMGGVKLAARMGNSQADTGLWAHTLDWGRSGTDNTSFSSPRSVAHPRNVDFVDTDEAPGAIGGEITFTGAADPTGITGYRVMWNDGTLIADVPRNSSSEGITHLLDHAMPLAAAPICREGNACNLVALTQRGANGWTLTRGAYGNQESAVFVFKGPGRITVPFLDLEENWDFLYIGDQALTGAKQNVGPIDVPAGQLLVRWESDYSVTAGGFVIHFTSPSDDDDDDDDDTPAPTTFRVPIPAGTPLQSAAIKVASLYGPDFTPASGIWRSVHDHTARLLTTASWSAWWPSEMQQHPGFEQKESAIAVFGLVLGVSFGVAIFFAYAYVLGRLQKPQPLLKMEAEAIELCP